MFKLNKIYFLSVTLNSSQYLNHVLSTRQDCDGLFNVSVIIKFIDITFHRGIPLRAEAVPVAILS